MELLEAMGKFNQEMVDAGVLLAGEGLQASSQGAKVLFKPGQKPLAIDGPFAETKELIAGYTLIQVRSREEALEWSRRYPNPAGEGITTEIEVRPLYELEDFVPSDAIERFKTIGLPD